MTVVIAFLGNKAGLWLDLLAGFSPGLHTAGNVVGLVARVSKRFGRPFAATTRATDDEHRAPRIELEMPLPQLTERNVMS